jgi:cystathionine gamma-synthase
MKIETVSVHAGNHVDLSTGAVIQPIHLATTFERDADGNFSRGYKYTRHSNPNREALEQCLCQLEEGGAAAAFSSGSAASMAVFQALKPGDHVIVPDDMYHGVAHLLRTVFASWSLQISFVDLGDLKKIQEAIRPSTKLIWIETPSNPLLKVTDIEKISALAHKVGALCVCDNTFATPVLQRPFKLGADVIVHSSTKYLGGHSDVLGGILIAKKDDDFFKKIREVQTLGGAVPAPFDCFLTLRGIRTLPYRIRAHSVNAMTVAKFLSAHPSVEKTFYPGLETDAGHILAAKQMSLFGGMISFLAKGRKEKAIDIAARVKIFTRATSLGGVESLIEHRASIEGPETKTPDTLLRLSIGLENPEDLMQDLDQAMK